MFPYKFAPVYSQKNDTSQVGATFTNPLKRSNFDAVTNANFAENTQKMASDGSFFQSLSSRRVESQLSNSAYLHRTSDVVNNNPPIVLGTSSLFQKDEPLEISLNSRTFATYSSSPSGPPKRFVAANTQGPNPNVAEADLDAGPDDVFYAMRIKFHKLEKENADQRKCIMDLESQLAVKKQENTTLSRDLALTENSYKQAIDKHRDAVDKVTKKQSLIQSDLDDLKLASRSSSLTISDAKVAMEAMVALRDSTLTRLRDIESMFDNDGRFILTAESRETVHELRSELSKTQQVADLYRDKLHTMGTELAEARTRAMELEELITADRKHSGLTATEIRQSAEQVVELTRYLEAQKHESMEATKKAYEMEQRFVQVQTQLQEAQSTITSMKEEMSARNEFQEEQDKKLRTLCHTIDFQGENVKTLEARTRVAEEEMVQTLNHTHELQGRLDAAKSLEKNLTQQASRLLAERDEASRKLESVERQLTDMQNSERKLSSELAKTLVERNVLIDKLKLFDEMKRELDRYREKHAECQVSVKVLQERYDDQLVTLAASKESIVELQVNARLNRADVGEATLEQERLRETEHQATDTSDKSKQEMIHLQEQIAVLRARVDHADKERADKTSSLRALQIELSRKEGAFEAILEAEKSNKNDALGQLQETKTKMESLLTELAQKDHHIQGVTKRLAAAEAPSAEREREVAGLTARIGELEENEKRLVDRAMTICHRYERNDLNEDEKSLVSLLVNEARARNNREMEDKLNEIKRRDNLIKEHKARNLELETVLKRLMAEKRPGILAGPNTQHDTTLSTSTKGNDEPGNAMAVDATKPPSSDQHPETRGVGQDTTAAHSTCNGAVNPSNRSAGHATFAKLCREASDEIAQFDDETPRMGKRTVLFAGEEEEGRPVRRTKHAKGVGVDKWESEQPIAPKKRATKRR